MHLQQLVEIRNLITEIGKDKIVLLSTHILQEIPKICNHIIIINKGKIVENIKMKELEKSKINLEDHFQKLTNNIICVSHSIKMNTWCTKFN